MTMGLRLVAIFARFHAPRVVARPDMPQLADYKKLPRVSLLVPLLREEAVARRLLDALAAMDYPAALLDIKLVLEADDAVTRAAIDRAELPPNIEVVSVPRDGLRTKPRAMNYALPFCTGEIVGIYDAEDRPDPAQIRAVVEHLRHAPPEVACVQGFLDFYNSDRNWLSRCFTLEYAIWFRVVLLGVQRLGLPIPLGGTTVFFRRNVLEKIGAWDAHNVTEDADLGMRLARFGYRCDMIASTTWEEANCRVRPWIRQRSRWLKGYAITWATHMRRPRALLSELGPMGFLGFQVLFLGAITSYLSMPLFWLIWTASIGFDLTFWQSFPTWLTVAFFASMIAGQALMLVIATVAARDSRHPGLLPWVLALPLYWPLGAIAAYRAVGEVFTRPFHWHKTEHGIGGGPK
jgi:cellulose synthase/poly-beta-1,6-N-acetylglucosamine synthase-like glycosyltransferase